jgi:hypothetical protein
MKLTLFSYEIGDDKERQVVGDDSDGSSGYLNLDGGLKDGNES